MGGDVSMTAGTVPRLAQHVQATMTSTSTRTSKQEQQQQDVPCRLLLPDLTQEASQSGLVFPFEGYDNC
ncbi:hypothetical protein M406DRAFT_104730 [Cryphonectria parasitica EP155]|uniref:Uncharacterized protein n=1 Tax=Cryphonectria parasitica (strain ATCC 38755 / EP155) TaxID=660469 RepID=A0A9P4YA46_CRYP1|nr:uncharacterized protein M406DRAFT_104730 [Cryphonectria parasitica EP155]KAF3769298.1 hypothetical protein M406DRAFT_104730 [Cryphonectria parasitica EP155]